MVLVIAEAAGPVLNAASVDLIASVQRTGLPVSVVLPDADPAPLLEPLVTADLAGVVALEHPGLTPYTADAFVAALAALIAAEAPVLVVGAHTYRARDFMPTLAARLRRPLATDCTSISIEDGRVRLTRPMFSGKLVATVSLEGPPPHFATFQHGSLGRVDLTRAGTPRAVRRVSAVCDPGAVRQRPEPPYRETAAAVDLSQASRIVAVGRGVKERDQLKVVEALAAALGAELAASRPICDAGWLPMTRQVGSSGQTVAPRLYVAVGISGAIQHVVGMRGARTIVAINKDPDAPIFDVADFGIVGDLFDVVPAIVRALR